LGFGLWALGSSKYYQRVTARRVNAKRAAQNLWSPAKCAFHSALLMTATGLAAGDASAASNERPILGATSSTSK
jgi:hypothetical protein